MKNRCDEYEELIWGHARAGSEMAEDVRRHLDDCQSCSDALGEARQVLDLLAAGDCVGDAPDCRSAVMAKISCGRRPFRVAWAYACAGIVIAAAVTGGIVTHRGPTPPPPAPMGAKKTVTHSHEAPVAAIQSMSDTPKVAQSPVAEPKRRARQSPRGQGRKHIRRLCARSSPAPRGGSLESPAPNLPRAVAAVAVTYPVAEEQGSESYAYVEKNARTGETTRCSVTRSGNTVDIYLESTTGGDAPPLKGSIQNENTSNA